MKRFKRGDVVADMPGMRFFRYSRGKEVWVTNEIFEHKKKLGRAVDKKWKQSPAGQKYMREYFRKYNHLPNQKEYHSEYYKQPEVRERYRIKYHASPKREEEQLKAEQKRIEREAWKNSPEHIAKVRAVARANYDRNKKKITARLKERRITDPQFRLTGNMRRCIRQTLTRKHHHKTGKTEELLGCSFADFEKHIESRFLPGMSWKNMAKWSVDHIIAVTHFFLSGPVAQRYAFHFLNCRPLWNPDNLKKSDITDWSLVDKYNLYEWIPYTNLQYKVAA